MPVAVKSIRSGSHVAINHIVSACITLVSFFWLSKILGPESFAIITLCASTSSILRIICRLGINTSLLAQKDEPRDEDYNIAFTTMFFISLVVTSASIICLPLLASFSHVANLIFPGIATFLLLPLYVFPLPAVTLLERKLNLKPVVAVELGGQIIGQVLGVSLAYCGFGIWGPIAGWWVRAVFQAIMPWLIVATCPRLYWQKQRAFKMIVYGGWYVATTSLVQGRNLLLLLLVGKLSGQVAVGYMGLVLRAVGLVAPFRAAVSRVIFPTISPVADIPHILRERIKTTVEIELFLSIPVIVFSVYLYPIIIKSILGASWEPTAILFPWIAAGMLLTSVHASSLSALHVKGFFIESMLTTIISYGVLAIVASIGAARMGVEGCAVATVAIWPTYWLGEWFAHRRLGTSWSSVGVLWAVGGAVMCLHGRTGLWIMIVPLLIVALTGSTIRDRSKLIIGAFLQKG